MIKIIIKFAVLFGGMSRKEDVLNEYEIALVSLKYKTHLFNYRVGNEFFKCFEGSPVEVGDLEIEVSLDKSETLLNLEVSINGTVNLQCDRSLDLFDYTIDKKAFMVYKYGEEYQELSDELIVLPEGVQALNIASLIYELLVIDIPFKKLHPRYASEEDMDDDEELEVVYLDESAEPEETSEEKESTWEDLKKKFNK